jgi:Domain of unknown function (DUF222)/HNH endonuclease
MDLAEVERDLDEALATDPYAYSDPTSLKTLYRIDNKVDALKTKALMSFEDSGEWAVDGARSSVGWIAAQCLLPTAEVRGQLRRGKMLEKSPLVAEAFSAGEIGAAQVDGLARARRTNESIFERDQAMLVESAKTLKFGDFCTAITYWEQFADPDGAEEAEFERANRRDVWVSESANGMYLGQITLDPASGKIYANEHERLEQIFFEADWAEAKERLGREPTLNDLRRTPAHRRADAATEMAIRSASTAPGAQRPEPLITFVIDFPTAHGRICQIEGGPIVSPGLVIHHMPGAWFERVVFKPNNRIECSEKSRFFTGSTRRAIEVRDFECSNAYCENPRRRLQIDHIIPYSKGGLTNQGNGRVLCAYCNRMRNWRELGPPGG